MDSHHLGKLALVGIGTFAAIWIGGVLLALLWALTSCPSRMVAFLATMFAVTGAVLAVVIWTARGIPLAADFVKYMRELALYPDRANPDITLMRLVGDFGPKRN